MKKEERGSYKHVYDSEKQYSFCKMEGQQYCHHGYYDFIEPLSKVKRWSAKDKQKVDILQPLLFNHYNSSMGGVDLLDQAVNTYRILIQGKKWYLTLWAHMLNVAMVNAWKIYSLANSDKIYLLRIMRDVTRHYLRCYEKSTFFQKQTKRFGA